MVLFFSIFLMSRGVRMGEKLEFLCLQLLGKTKECPGTAKHCMAPGWAFIPELRMAVLGLV